MIRLIGFRCTHSNMFSQEVLIAPFLLGNLKTKLDKLITRIETQDYAAPRRSFGAMRGKSNLSFR